MATNLALDDRLLEEALRIGGKATKKDTVTALFGTIDYDPKYDYKKQRSKR